MGDHPEHLVALVGGHGRKAVVPGLAARRQCVHAPLRTLPQRRDVVFRDLLAADALVYAGYSAGACVLSPTLRGLEIVDDAGTVMRIYGSEPVWDGLALLKEAFVPHYQSPRAANAGDRIHGWAAVRPG
jgi:hypothetical protein